MLVTHGATLDVPRHTVDFLARLLAAHRRRIGTPRAPGPLAHSGRPCSSCAGSVSATVCTAWHVTPDSVPVAGRRLLWGPLR